MDISPQNPDLSASGSPSTYMGNRAKYARPQALLFSDNYGTISGGKRVPYGREKEDFIILSDHNRSDINISNQRIESRMRMSNGTMRSYHIADKIALSVSWSMLPSRSYSRLVNYRDDGTPIMQYVDENGDVIESSVATEYTVDGGAGGVELLDWYENHTGPFYVYLAYDKYNNDTFKTFGKTVNDSFAFLDIYNDIKLMYFSSFEYTIQKRGATNHDFWTVTLALEEA